MKRGKIKKSNKKINSIKKNKLSLNNKKILAVAIAGFFVLAFFLMFINYQQNISITGHATFVDNIKEIGKGISESLGPIFRFLFDVEKTATTKEVTQTLLSYILAFVIILGIFWLALNKIDFFQERPAISNVLIFTISILAVRGLAEFDVIKEVFFPYGVFGVVAITALPFLAAFVLINLGLKGQAPILRRTLWILFAVVFCVFWIIRYDKLKNLSWVYFVTAILSVIMASIDGTIKGFFAKMEAEKLENINKADLRGKLIKQKKEYEKMYQKNQLSKKDYDLLTNDLKAKAKAYRIKKLI